MKILVTGGAGFIGNNFVRYWLKGHSKDQVINLDKLTYAGHLYSTKDFADNPNYKFVKGDVIDSKLVDALTIGVDYLVHFAAESHVDRSILHPEEFIKSNVLGTQVLLDSAVKNKVKRYHQISTDEVFGSLELNSKEKFDEDRPFDPRSPYSASKAGADCLVKAYFHTYGLPITITNSSNNYGPFQDPEKFIPRQITNFILGKKSTIYGDGKHVRDWLHVDDHCRAIEAVLLKGRPGETYCVGGQIKETSNLEIVRTILTMMKLDKSYIQFAPDRPGHDRKYVVDWTKINKELGWKPKYDIDIWLEKTIQWYQTNEWWWKPLKKRAESIYNHK